MMNHEIVATSHAPMIFDVTIRDGSYVIDFQFRPEDVQLLYRALDDAGLPYIEIGHGFGLNASSVKGTAAATDDEYLAAAASACRRSRFGTFFIPGIGNREHLRRARCEYGMHFVRIGNEPENSETLLPYLEYAKNIGLEVMANFMKSYSVTPAELARRAAVLVQHGADAVYIVDSAGGMLPDEVGAYVRAIADACTTRIGFHGHNNLELAISNTISAWRNGATLLDCSIGGLGRSSGNTRMELLIPVLRAMGVNPPYDFQAVLRIWQQILRPILQRRPVEASEVVGGYARIHSGAMAPFHEAAQRYRVSLEELIEAYGDTVHGRRPVAAVEDLAAELASQMATDSGREMGSLLKMQSTLTDPHFVRNTLRSMDEILRAARVLSRKAFLPIVVVVSVQPAVADEAYVAGEYLYHDDHFIVLRATFSSVTLFARVMQAHRGEIGILVFETTSESLRRELVQRKDEWLGIEKVVWRNIPAANYHYLFAVLYQAAASISARTALIFGASADRLVNLSVPGLTQLELYCMGSSAEVLSKVDIIPVQPDLWGARSAEGQRPSFDIAVLVAPISSLELDAILAQMPPTGVVLDCLNQAVYHTAILHKSPQRIVPVSLWRSISGELLNLLDSEVCRIGEIPVHAVAAEPGTAPEEKLHESRAA